MAKQMYIGVEGKARKIKKGYIGVDGVARKIKKGYIGIDGIARCFFGGGGGELSYYGKATPLTASRDRGAGASAGDVAYLAGGYSSSSGSYVASGAMERYTADLVKLQDSGYPGGAIYDLTGISFNNYALFAGGRDGSANVTTLVATIDASGTQKYFQLNFGRSKTAAAVAGDHVLFAGGYDSYSGPSGAVDAFDKSLTKVSSYMFLGTYRHGLAGIDAGNHALFAGGQKVVDDTAVYTDVVEAYDASLTRSTVTTLILARHSLSAAKAGKYALFAGGFSSSYDYNDTIDVYDESLVYYVGVGKLSYARSRIGAASLGDYAIFAGGASSQSYRAEVDVWDGKLTKVPTTNISPGRYDMMVATVGNYALFAGGSHHRAEVDVYQLS